MSFTSFQFIAFFLLVLAGRRLARNFAAEKWVLLAASCMFYMSWSVPCILLILAMSMADYSVAGRIAASSDPAIRKRLLQTSLLINVGLLGCFKYSNFFLENLTGFVTALGWEMPAVRFETALPPAISYFTFAGLSYVLDVYYERMPACRSPRDYALFITFFPKLLSGPIARAREFLPQLQARVRASAEDIEIGVAYFLTGAVKKLVVADQLAGHVNLIFASPTQYDGFTLFQGLLGYAVQIYCDFSGYADMAIGCARILGFRLPENFQMPFSAVSITEFWRRWHMTLSRWFRDYAFLPLEMATRSNPSPALRISVNLMMMMILVGLWHGASWNFVLVGGIHGAALAIHQLWTAWNPLRTMEHNFLVSRLWTVCARVLTLSVVLLGFVFFRADSLGGAVQYLQGMLTWNSTGTRMMSPYILPALGAVIFLHLVLNKDKNYVEILARHTPTVRVAWYTCLLFLLACLGATEAAPFVYFQF